MTERSDVELLKRSHRKEQAAFEELIARHGAAVKGYALRMLRSPEQAEEIYVETFERLLRREGRWEDRGSVRGLLFTIAHNRCIDVLRKRKRQRESLPHIIHLEEARRYDPSPEGKAVLGELADALELAITRLPEQHREVLLLRTVHGFSGQQVAEIVGLSESQVRSQLAYARKELRRRMTEQGLGAGFFKERLKRGERR